jgi:hypothetical protein
MPPPPPPINPSPPPPPPPPDSAVSYGSISCTEASATPDSVRPTPVQGETLQNTYNNMWSYGCLFAKNHFNLCTGRPCPAGTDYFHFVGYNYNGQYYTQSEYDSGLDSCGNDIACATSQCARLCWETWGSSCVSYTASVQGQMINLRFAQCFTYSTDCIAEDDATPQSYGAFAGRVWALGATRETYAGNELQGIAGTYFCHQYNRRSLSEAHHGRSLSQNVNEARVLVDNSTVELVRNGTFGGKKIKMTQKYVIEGTIGGDGGYNYDAGEKPKDISVKRVF